MEYTWEEIFEDDDDSNFWDEVLADLEKDEDEEDDFV